MAEGFYMFTERDASLLADMLDALPPRARKVRTRLALMCLANTFTDRDGNRYFSIGRRQLAQKCHVSEKVARAFFDSMEREGLIVRCDRMKGRKGEYQVRGFAWFDALGGGPFQAPKGPTQGPKTPRKGPRGGPKTPRKGPLHTSQMYQMDGRASLTVAPRPQKNASSAYVDLTDYATGGDCDG